MGNYNFDLDLETANTMSIINNWITPKSKVLEFGSANGRLTRYLCQEKKCKITIVEIDEDSGKQASEYAERFFIGEELGDIEKYHWYDEKELYDFIIFADVLEHLHTPQEVLAKCVNLMRTNGKILVSIPNVTHNAILLAMLNDRFDYQTTGLLDNTHIHFFTYKTFCEMAEKCELGIFDVVPVYGRVGDIEIKNKYTDVPVEIEKYLRKRIPGEIYQYVFALQRGKEKLKSDEYRVEGFRLEEHIMLETQLYYKKKEEEYTDAYRCTQKYFDNQNVKFEVQMNSKQTDYIRWDPLEDSGIVCLKDASIRTGENKTKLQIRATNATWTNGKIFVFKDKDPWVEFKTKVQDENEVFEVVLQFQIIELRKTDEYYDYYLELMEFINADAQEYFQERIAELELQQTEHKKYITHLEKDIVFLKEEIEKVNAKYNHTIESKINRVLNRE